MAAIFVAPIIYAIESTLALLGFTAVGPAAGSIAAWVQATIYGAAVPAGSLFSVLQAIGMGAAIGPATLAAVGTAITAAIVLATWPILALWWRKVPRSEYIAWVRNAVSGDGMESLHEFLRRMAARS